MITSQERAEIVLNQIANLGVTAPNWTKTGQLILVAIDAAVKEAVDKERRSRAVPGQPMNVEELAYWRRSVATPGILPLLGHIDFLEGLLGDIAEEYPDRQVYWNRGRVTGWNRGLERAAGIAQDNILGDLAKRLRLLKENEVIEEGRVIHD